MGDVAGFNRLRWVVIWIWTATFLEAAYIVVLLSAQGGPCGGDGGSPRAQPGSEAAAFCSTWVDWTDTTDLVSIVMYSTLPILSVGAIGIWRRSRLVLTLAFAAELTFIFWLAHTASIVGLGH
jgi:hypothetical protein